MFALPALAGHHPLASLRTALAIHREHFTLPRDCALWLAFNPLDLAWFLGVPVAVAWAVRTSASAARRPRQPIDRMRLAMLLGLGVLLLAGITRGEVGRIWIPLMPTLLVAALVRPGGPTRAETLACGGALAALCLAMATYWQVP